MYIFKNDSLKENYQKAMVVFIQTNNKVHRNIPVSIL